MRRLVRSTLLAALAALLAAAALAAGGDDGPEAAPEETPLERWRQMSDAERREMERRFEKFRELSAEKRRQLEEQSERLESRRRRALSWLDEEQRQRLEQLPVERRRRVLREFFRQESLADGERVRAKLPRDLLERLEAAEPLERGPILETFRQSRRVSSGLRLLEVLGRELGVDAEERRGWAELDREAQGALLMQLGRSFVRARVELHGPPADLSAEDWQRLDELGDLAFFDAWRRLQPGPEYAPARGPRPEREDAAGGEAPAAESPAAAPEEPEAAPEEPVREKREWLRVRALAKPTMEELIELADLPVRERRAEFAERGRERVLRYLHASDLVEPELLAELEGVRGRRFHERMRELVVANTR